MREDQILQLRQIREGLQVLAKTKIHLTAEDGDDLVFSPIADFGYFSDKTVRDPANKDAAKATVYIRFNALISQAILSRSWRQINYDRIIGADMYLVRWLRKMRGCASPRRRRVRRSISNSPPSSNRVASRCASAFPTI
ncbi:MAG: hypothetical protein IPL91_15875 [Hyphomicrobium sp.]|nr:hypothetical protein [Hyphomicrobium sp.]